ncbi:BCAS4 (predicted) [Pycnogonum litorale]
MEDADVKESKQDINLSSCALHDLTRNYSDFLTVDTSKQKEAVHELVDDFLMRLDEFCNILDIVQGDSTMCLQNTVPEIYEKSLQLENIYEKIDNLENFLSMVRKNVDAMEEKVTQAEQDLGATGTFKKMFTSLYKTTPKISSPVKEYEAPEIFVCDNLFVSLDCNE